MWTKDQEVHLVDLYSQYKEAIIKEIQICENVLACLEKKVRRKVRLKFKTKFLARSKYELWEKIKDVSRLSGHPVL